MSVSRRRGRWLAAAAAVALMLPLGVAGAVFHHGLPWWLEDGDRNHRHESDAGALRYQVHLPPQYDGTTRLPVVMAVHGCAMSGAGAAVVLAATHPDIFASATSVAGGEYGLNQVDPDDVVPVLAATRLVEPWTAVNDLVDDGLPNDSLDLVEETTRVPAREGRHAYTRTTLTTPVGESLVESYLVHGMGHAWPGPDGHGLFTDHAGPDASALVWDFARRHPRTPRP
ncbi:hypothetical protein [Nocardioides campestrisoli]|uniref:hypothetical protein n=1 Tax=Nocardioides campestrisoli TaxID=2736757 RepID=UPI0015E70ED4|nr:hypothetical protein [Nocardioides campestrisoli]